MTINETLYNLYRPSSFEGVKGQDHIIKPLLRQIANQTLPHSIIFYGPPGVGKTTTARLVAKAYNESSSGVKEIDAAQDRKIDSIRRLIPTFSYAPLEGDFQTVIFDEAHAITNDAFQALQKVVEEPPPGLRFIFVTTRIDKIPSTIVSRSQRHNFTKVDNRLVLERLKEVSSSEFDFSPTDELFEYAVQVADRSLRDGLVALGQIVALTNQDSSEIDIAEALGILGGPKIAEFLFLYLKRAGLKALVEAAEMFESEKIDSYRALSDFQQYIIDSLIYLKDETCKDFLKFNVSNLVEKVDSIAVNQGLDIHMIRNMMAKDLEKVYDLSVTVEDTLARTKNSSAAFKYFVVQLNNVTS